jgi:hypothetical protein
MPKKVNASPKVTKKLGSKVKKEKEYKLEAHLNDTVIKTEGDTLLEAIQAFVTSDEFPFAVKTKVFLKYSHGDVERHKLLPLAGARTILRRLKFSEDQAKFLAEKLTHELTY